MKEWSELEERYQELRKKDQREADKFKGRMTHRFQVFYFPSSNYSMVYDWDILTSLFNY